MKIPLKRFSLVASLVTPLAFIPGIVTAQSQGAPGKFDFYVLALSWSPDYCASKGDSDPQQCGSSKKLSFVLHGLWPQYQRGYPTNCSTEKMPSSVKQQFSGLYPSTKLYDHEWEKHGTCTGQTPAQYLGFSKQIKDSVVIPTAYNQPKKPFRTTLNGLKQDFSKANSQINANSIAPSCSGSGRFLQEVLICYSKDGNPIGCSPEVLKRSQKSCGQPDFLVRSVR